MKTRVSIGPKELLFVSSVLMIVTVSGLKQIFYKTIGHLTISELVIQDSKKVKISFSTFLLEFPSFVIVEKKRYD